LHDSTNTQEHIEALRKGVHDLEKKERALSKENKELKTELRALQTARKTGPVVRERTSTHSLQMRVTELEEDIERLETVNANGFSTQPYV
jgi:regulator of replication initiation timing